MPGCPRLRSEEFSTLDIRGQTAAHTGFPGGVFPRQMEKIERTEEAQAAETGVLPFLEKESCDFSVGSARASAAEAGLISRSAARHPKQDAARTVVTDQNGASEVLKRTVDIVGALALTIVLLPALLLLCLVVAITSGTSPIFAHSRVGRGGKSFSCYKFRSMCVDSEARLERLLEENPSLREEWELHHKLAHDPRVTQLGKFLRTSSLDELPQLVNVLLGDMSLVGPRPIVSSELEKYGRHVSTYLTMKPGLTGLWQISGRSSTSYRRRVAIDRVYSREHSFWLDTRIILATVPAVLLSRDAC